MRVHVRHGPCTRELDTLRAKRHMGGIRVDKTERQAEKRRDRIGKGMVQSEIETVNTSGEEIHLAH